MISKKLSCLAVKFVPPSHCLSYGFRKYFPQQIPVFENAKGKRKTNVFLGKNDKHAFMIKVSRFLAKFKVSFVYSSARRIHQKTNQSSDLWNH